MNYDLQPDTTRYGGINYRSKLEAKWAAFFDLIEWQYSYEPSKIGGRIPDFLLRCSSPHYSTNIIIAEVKPCVFVDDKFKRDLLASYKNVEAHLLILDDFPFLNADSNNNLIRLGIGSQFFIPEDGNYYEHDSFDEFVMKSHNDFCSATVSWQGVMHGRDNLKQLLDFRFNGGSIQKLKRLWYEAGNIIQFPSYNKRRAE